MGAVGNKEVRAAGKVLDSDLVYVDAEIVVERREDLAEGDGAFVGLAAEAIRGADDLAGFHFAGQERASDPRPVARGIPWRLWEWVRIFLAAVITVNRNCRG